MEPENEEEVVNGQQKSLNPEIPPPTLRYPIKTESTRQPAQQQSSYQSTSPSISRFDQSIPRFNIVASRSPVRDTNRQHTFDPMRSPDQQFLPSPMEPRFQQGQDLARLNTGTYPTGADTMTRSPVEQSPHPDYTRNVNDYDDGNANAFMPMSPGGSRLPYSMTKGQTLPGGSGRRDYAEPSAPGEFRRRITGESSLGGDHGRTRRGSAEKLLQV